MFSIYLSRNLELKSSRMFLGGYDTNFFDVKTLSFHRVIRKSWWTLNLEKVFIGGKDTGLCNKEDNCEIIMDTGASLMATPPGMYSDFLDAVTKNGKCENMKSFPTIGFQID